MITREHVLAEIKRSAASNGGVPLGESRFEQETGIKPSQWGRYWARFGDAQKDAGFEANIRTIAIPEDDLLRALALLTRELGKCPTAREITVKRHGDSSFPSLGAFKRRGGLQEITRRLAIFCRQSEFADVAELLPDPQEIKANGQIEEFRHVDGQRIGYVYLLKFRRNDYKIGASNDPERRFGEIATKMPERPDQIHTIKTDDPFGVEAYWHRRFASKQIDKNSEWFQLSSADVRAFRRWTRIF